MQIKLRKAKRKDYSDVIRLLEQLHKVHMDGRPELFVLKESPLTKSFYESMISNDEMIAILAEFNHRIIGVCLVSMLNTSGMVYMKTGYIDKIVVDEPYRRQGIGRLLFEEAENQAIKKGAQRIDLMVWNFNGQAIKAYESYGMTPQRTIYEKKL